MLFGFLRKEAVKTISSENENIYYYRVNETQDDKRHDDYERRHQFPWFWFLITIRGGVVEGRPGELLTVIGNGKFENSGIYVKVC